jgi:glutamate racemase
MSIGIFDSGHGGTLVAEKLKLLLPEYDYLVVSDPEHAPYGERSYDEIIQLTDTAIQPLLSPCSLIVLACNTATVAAITFLRKKYPETQFVGFEPMIKPAARATKTHHFTLLATHATAHAPRTQELIKQYAPVMIIDIPNTIGWAKAIDHNTANLIDLSEVVESIKRGSDSIIIGCTHYIALQPRLEALGVNVLEPTDAIARRIVALKAE